MVLDTRFNLLQRNTPATLQHRCSVVEGVMFVDGERVADYRPGVDTMGTAVNRHLASKSKAKPATQLSAPPATTPTAKTAKPRGFASKLKFGQKLNAFKPNGTAA